MSLNQVIIDQQNTKLKPTSNLVNACKEIINIKNHFDTK